MSIAVPHCTHFFPPAFSAMFPPIVDAQAEVGSVAKMKPRSRQYSMTSSVTAPASTPMIGKSPGAAVATVMPWILLSFSVLTTMVCRLTGTAPAVRPVPPPRGMIDIPSFRAAPIMRGSSSTESGYTTATGCSTRQSVASVECATRSNGSNLTFFCDVASRSARSNRFRRRRIPPTLSKNSSSTFRTRARSSRASLFPRAEPWTAEMRCPWMCMSCDSVPASRTKSSRT